MPTFISFDEFSGVVSRGSGILLFAITPDCGDDAAERLAGRLRRAAGPSAAVHLLCADVGASPVLVYYQGGDPRPLLTREDPGAVRRVADDVAEAARLAAARQLEAAERTERMLASERLDHFPPFFQMARSLARDAWRAARETAQGAPLLLPSDAAAARLQVCQGCPSLRGDRCVECGCYMTVKAHIAAMRCPLSKWPNVD